MKTDIYAIITDRFISQLEKGTVPWQKPWVTTMNLVTQKPYRGINVFALACEERESPWWMSYKQAAELGGNIKKGEKSAQVIYWQRQEMKDKAGIAMLDSHGRPRIIPFIRWSNVFNLEQTENIKEPELTKEVQTVPKSALEKAQKMLESANVCELQIMLNGQNDRAVYKPTKDAIEIPNMKRFPNRADYYHTCFHELSHATGHASRLNREGITEKIDKGSERYAREELIAELSAAFLSNEAGILGDVQFQNSAGYLKSWIEALQNNPKMIIGACSAAQKASAYIQGERENTTEAIKEMISGFNPELQPERELEHERI